MKTVMKTEILKSSSTMKATASMLVLGLSLAFAPAVSATSAKAGPTTTAETVEIMGLEGVKPDTYPVAVVTPAPKYPRRALSIEREGWVVVELDIDEQGMPLNAEIVDRSKSVLFAQNTLKAMKEFRFEPATYNGKAVPVSGKRYKVVYAFQDS